MSLSRSEVRSIIRNTFYAHRRRNERIMSRSEMREWWHDMLRRHNVVLPAAIAEAAEVSICDSFVCAQCLTHEEYREAFRKEFASLGLSEVMVEEMINFNVGHIFLYEDAIAEDCGNIDKASTIADVVLCYLFHERRHSYQPYKDIQEQCKAAGENYASDANAHHAVLCEQDANSWGAWQVSYLRTGSVETRKFPQFQDETQTHSWAFMGE